MGEQSREGQAGVLQRLGFIAQFSFSSMRYHKLWCATHSHMIGDSCGGGGQGAGCWEKPSVKALHGLPQTPSDPPGPQEARPVGQRAVGRLSRQPPGAGTDGAGEKEPRKHSGQTLLCSGTHLARLTASRSEFWKLLGAWNRLGGGWSSGTLSTAG